jgi:hypothetical protein
MNSGKVLRFGLAALTVVYLWCATASPAFTQEGKPNVVFILADNVGYGDLGPYGGGELRGAPTPRIDQLAREGLRLTQYLVEPGCTPSRAALMTGQYSIRNGLSLIIVPGSESTLSKGAVTMGELFKSALKRRAARRTAGEGAANRRGRRGRAIAHRQALHAGSPRRDRHRTGREVHRLHEAANSRRETLLSLFAVLDGAFS